MTTTHDSKALTSAYAPFHKHSAYFFGAIQSICLKVFAYILHPTRRVVYKPGLQSKHLKKQMERFSSPLRDCCGTSITVVSSFPIDSSI